MSVPSVARSLRSHVALVALASGLLAGCGPNDRADSDEGTTVVTQPGEVDQKGMVVSNGNRTGVLADGMPKGLPRDLPRYPGSRPVDLGRLRPKQSDRTRMVVLATSDDFETVDDWYARHVPRSFTAHRLTFQTNKISTYDRTQGRYSGAVMIRVGRDPVTNDRATMITLLTRVKS